MTMDESNPPSNSFFPQGHDLSEEWVKTNFNGTDWRAQLLMGICQFLNRYCNSIESLGRNWVLQFSLPTDEAQLQAFLNMFGQLTYSQPQLLPQGSADNLYVLIPRP